MGKGLNNYDAIFTELKRVGFDNWISIEDGVEGTDELEHSVAFLKRKSLNTGIRDFRPNNYREQKSDFAGRFRTFEIFESEMI